MAITGRAGALALLGVPAVLLVDRPWAVVAAMLLLVATLVVVDLTLAAPVRSLHLSRSGATATRQGEQVAVILGVHNLGGRLLRARVRDAWPPSAGAWPRVHDVRVPPGERRPLETTLVPTRRGDRHAERVTVRSLGPLGLAGRQGRHVAPWTVRVVPPFASRRFLPERLSRLRQLDGAVSARGRGQGTEFDALRDYVDGDDVRSIDWRATARRDNVVVRTWRPERDRRVVLVLDTGRTSAARLGDATRLDIAIDAALLLGALAARAGDRVSLVAHDRVPRASVDAGGRAEVLPALVDVLTPLEPALLESDAGAMVAAVVRRVRHRALVVIFSDLNTAVVEEGLLPVLGQLTRRHTVVLAAVTDPRLDAMSRRRGDAAAVYSAAAAQRTLTERGRLAALLRERGVEVVAAPSAEFAPAVADAYLGLKAAGRL